MVKQFNRLVLDPCVTETYQLLIYAIIYARTIYIYVIDKYRSFYNNFSEQKRRSWKEKLN